MKVLVGNFIFLEKVRDGIEKAIVKDAIELDLPEDYDLELLLDKIKGY